MTDKSFHPAWEEYIDRCNNNIVKKYKLNIPLKLKKPSCCLRFKRWIKYLFWPKSKNDHLFKPESYEGFERPNYTSGTL